MKSSIVRYGVISLIGSMIMGIGSQLVFWHQHNILEKIGYGGFLVFLLTIYLGVRRYRDVENGGSITFARALKVAMLIVLLPALIVPLVDIFYTSVVDPVYLADYYDYKLEELSATLTSEELETKREEYVIEMKSFENPFTNYLIMFLFVLSGGFICSLIVAIFIKKQVSL